MNVQLRGQASQMSEALRSHAERCLEFALRRFGNRIDRVTVWVVAENDPRGGVDKGCRIDGGLRPTGSACAAETASDAYAAVGRAAGRIGRAVARRVTRDQARRPDLCERGRSANRPALMEPWEEG